MRWEILGLIFIGLFVFVYSKKEGFDNPQSTSQLQQGDIVTLRKQVTKFTISEESLNILEGELKKISDHSYTLQKNMPSGQVEKYSK